MKVGGRKISRPVAGPGGGSRLLVRHFTLMEALVALLLLAMVATAMASLIFFHVRLSDYLDRKRQGAQLATSRMEQLGQAPFEQLLFADEDGVPVNQYGVPNEEGPYYRTSVFTTDADGNVVITVTVESGGDSMRPRATFQLISVRSQ